jgi:hypothetical protein
MTVRDSLARYFVNCPPKQWQFITLTIRSNNAPLALQLDWLTTCFKRLRTELVWKTNVTHGFAVLEITRNVKTLKWHPHLHILAHVRFLDWSKLRSTWSHLTHGSNVIDCRRIRDEADAITPLVAYMGKPPADSVLHDDAAMIELYQALHSQHLLIRFGHPPIKPPPPVTVSLPLDLIYLGSIETLIDDAINGSPRARTHLERWLLQRRIDAHSLNCDQLLNAMRRHPPKRLTDTEAIALESDLAQLRSDLLPATPF